MELHFHKNTKDQLEAIHLKNLIFTAKISKTVTNNDCHNRRLPSVFGSENIKIYFNSKKELKSRLVAFQKGDEHFLFFHNFSFWLYTKLFLAAKWSKKVIFRNDLKSLLGALTQKLWAFQVFIAGRSKVWIANEAANMRSLYISFGVQWQPWTSMRQRRKFSGWLGEWWSKGSFAFL